MWGTAIGGMEMGPEGMNSGLCGVVPVGPLERPLGSLEEMVLERQRQRTLEFLEELRGRREALPLSEQKCGNCLFRRPIDRPGESNDGLGQCNRYAPRSQFPITADSEWCGEWRVSPKVADAEL